MRINVSDLGKENIFGVSLAVAIGIGTLAFAFLMDAGPAPKTVPAHEVSKSILINPETGCRYELAGGEVRPLNGRDGRQLCAHSSIRAYF